MDRHDLVDRLPGERLRQRLPSVWEPADRDPGADEHRGEAPPEPEIAAPPEEPQEDEAGEEADRTRTLRSVLLGVALGSGVVAVLAALVRRLLGRGEAEVPAEAEPQQEEEETAPPLDEGTAAALGLAFLLGAEALRDWLGN